MQPSLPFQTSRSSIEWATHNYMCERQAQWTWSSCMKTKLYCWNMKICFLVSRLHNFVNEESWMGSWLEMISSNTLYQSQQPYFGHLLILYWRTWCLSPYLALSFTCWEWYCLYVGLSLFILFFQMLACSLDCVFRDPLCCVCGAFYAIEIEFIYFREIHGSQNPLST